MEFLAVKIIKTLALPPGIFLLVMLLGLLLWSRKRLISITLLWVSFIAFYLFSTPWLVFSLGEKVEYRPVLENAQMYRGITDAAIVVLGSGRYHDAPEFHGEDRLSGLGLQRVRYAGWLYEQTGLPVLTTGGRPLEGKRGVKSEAKLMAEHLMKRYGVPSIWLEEESRDTLDHGRLVPPILAEHGIKRVLLVTHAAHMRRSLAVFEGAGLQVIAAPTAYSTKGTLDYGVLLFRPSASAFQMNSFYAHEWLGDLWYRFRHGEQYQRKEYQRKEYRSKE